MNAVQMLLVSVLVNNSVPTLMDPSTVTVMKDTNLEVIELVVLVRELSLIKRIHHGTSIYRFGFQRPTHDQCYKQCHSLC